MIELVGARNVLIGMYLEKVFNIRTVDMAWVQPL